MLQEETKRVADAFETLKDNRIVIEGAGKIIDGVPFGKRDIEKAQALSDLKQYLTKGLPEDDKEYLETRVKAGLDTMSNEDYQVLKSEQIIKSIGTDEEYSLEEDNIEEEPAPVEEEKIVESADSTVAQEQVPEQLNNINNEEIAKIDALSKDEILKMMEEDKNAISRRINIIKSNNGKDEKRYTSKSGMTVSEYSVLSRMVSVLNSPQDYKEYRWEEYKGLKKDLLRMDSPAFKKDFNDIRLEEKAWINARLEEIKSNCINRDKTQKQETVVSYGIEILTKDAEEFGVLMMMKDIVDNFMHEKYPGQYQNLRRSSCLHNAPEIGKDLDEYMKGKATPVPPTPPINPEPPKPEPPKPEPPKPKPENDIIEVKSRKLWNGIKNHKKQILILAGIAAVAIVVSAAAALIPGAITALTKANAAEKVAQEVASHASQMIQNGNAWGAASAADKISLHGANVGLSNIISAKTGIATQFTPSTGVWTMGGKNLSEFAASSSAAVKQAASAVSAAEKALGTIIGSTFAGGIAGALSFGKGLSIVKKKSPECLAIKHEIDDFYNNALKMSEEKLTMKSSELSKKIRTSELITSEKKYLSRKLDVAESRIGKKLDKQEKMIRSWTLTEDNTNYDDLSSSLKKSPECVAIEHDIDEYYNNALNMSAEVIMKSSEFRTKIDTSDLDPSEKMYLLNKVSAAVSRIKPKYEESNIKEPVVAEMPKVENKQTFEDIYSSSDKAPEGLTEEEQAILDNVLNEETQIEEPSRSL